MNLKTLIIAIFSIALLYSCQNDSSQQEKLNESIQAEKIEINPIDQLTQVDDLLAELSEKPQILNAPTDKATRVVGAKGTVIHVDPDRLETVDGSPLGENIQIELLEMTDNSSMLLNNAQTVSNGEILVTGGAYYLNMTSDGKQLKMKKGKGLEVEFSKLSDEEMGLFLGDRDSLGQMNWLQTKESFETKNLKAPKEPNMEESTEDTADTADTTVSEIDLILEYIDSHQKEGATQEEIEEYKRLKSEYETASKTYESVELMNFGWINCDRFWKNPSPKTDIELLVSNDSLVGARMYAVFSDINSIMSTYYWKGMTGTASFNNIPSGIELTVIALSAKNETPLYFETTINTATDKEVQIQFNESTQAEIRDRMKRMN